MVKRAKLLQILDSVYRKKIIKTITSAVKDSVKKGVNECSTDVLRRVKQVEYQIRFNGVTLDTAYTDDWRKEIDKSVEDMDISTDVLCRVTQAQWRMRFGG